MDAVGIRELWYGDEEVAGYAHESLVLAMCRIIRPQNLEVLYTQFPGCKETEAVKAIVEKGYRRWRELEAAERRVSERKAA